MDAVPHVLGELIAYQDDSVVSKTIIKKEAGTVTLFAFDKGQALSTHSAPFDALILVVEGEAYISIADKESRVLAGELIKLPAHIPHAVSANEKFKMLLVMIKQ